MSRFSSIRFRLAGVVLLAVTPAVAVLVYTDWRSLWIGFVIGLFALAAAWLGGELFILRQVKSITGAAKRLTAGDLTSRTGLQKDASELGELGRSMDTMAETLERQLAQHERNEKALLNRAHQQTAIAAIGQFALVASDLPALLNQAALLVSQTLETEYGMVLELIPDEKVLLLRA